MGLISVSPILPLKSNLKEILMPLYDYKCECGKEFEVNQPMSAEKYTDCSEVGNLDCDQPNKLKRLIGNPTIFSDDIGRGHKRMKDKDLYKELDIE